MSTVRLENVSKSYKGFTALKNAAVTFEEGKIYGLLGRNGAGKTTLINILTGRIFSDGGRVSVDGENAVENDRAQGKIFCMTEKGSYPAELRGRAAFKWAKRFYPDFDGEYAEKLSEKFKLNTKKTIRSLSTGYSSIVKLILTLASGAPVLIFDEPVLGLDAGHRELFYRELLKRYAEKNCTVILSTHLIGEAADILERVVILKNGEVIADADADEILSGAYTVAGAGAAVEAYAKDKKVLKTESIGAYRAATLPGAPDRPAIEKLGLKVERAGLQELFVMLTNDGEVN